MSLIFCGLSPHPPLLVPAIGKDSVHRVEASQQALQALSSRIVGLEPDTVVIVTPHGPVHYDALSLLAADRFTVSFQGFDWSAEMRGDVALGERIAEEGTAAGYPVKRHASFDSDRYYFSRGLDHASMVPLYYLVEAGFDSRLVVISIAAWSHREHFEFGRVLYRVLESAPQRVVLLISGDLSHRLIPSAPAGYDPLGVEFDRRIVADLEAFDTRDVLSLDDEFIDRIGECGLRGIGMLFGALQEREARPEVLSYEGPFGVGYCVASVGVGAARDGGEAADSDASADTGAVLSLVRHAVEGHVRGEPLQGVPDGLPERLARRGAAFVCLKKDGVLRGCIGTTHPTQSDLAHELVANAVSAATRDPRFPPVRADELAHLSYSVDVLDEPEPVDSLTQLDPHRYGVIVRSHGKTGVLLPNLESIDTAEVQVDIARRKAGISAGDPLDIERFRVHRFERKE